MCSSPEIIFFNHLNNSHNIYVFGNAIQFYFLEEFTNLV
jgi:hypothetical protein